MALRVSRIASFERRFAAVAFAQAERQSKRAPHSLIASLELQLAALKGASDLVAARIARLKGGAA